MFGLGIKELIIIILILVLLFGLKNVPSVIKNFAQSWRIIKDACKKTGLKK